MLGIPSALIERIPPKEDILYFESFRLLVTTQRFGVSGDVDYGLCFDTVPRTKRASGTKQTMPIKKITRTSLSLN